MSQRHVPLPFVDEPVGIFENEVGRMRVGRATATAPDGPTIAPAGFYLLFVLNEEGVPSVARFIHLS